MNRFYIKTDRARTSNETSGPRPQVKNNQAVIKTPQDLALPPQSPEGDWQVPPPDTPPNLHRDIMIVPGFLSPEICNEYLDYIHQQEETDLSIFDVDATNESGETSWEVDKDARNTQTVDTLPIKEKLHTLMKHVVRDYLNPFFNVAIKDSEVPQMLIYHPGGHYKPHVDSEAVATDGKGSYVWQKNIDRDISMVLYLNDDYEGGDITFPNQAIKISPQAGMLIAFPSSHHFLHGVHPVVKGTRYAVVNWFSLGLDNPSEQV